MLGSNSGNRFEKKREYTNLKERPYVSMVQPVAAWCTSLLFPALLAEASPDVEVDEVDIDGPTYLSIRYDQPLRSAADIGGDN